MAQVTTTKIVEGNSSLVLKIDLVSDGSGELINFPILSPSDLSPIKRNNKPTFILNQAWYGLVWFDVLLQSGTLTPTPIWTFARDSSSHIDFRSFGGLPDRNVYIVPPVNDNGILTISTNGFTKTNYQGTLILELRKTNS